MSRFYANLWGRAKTEATREGTESSGIGAHIRGWNVGICVEGEAQSNGNDLFSVYLTSGSNGQSTKRLIGHATLENGHPSFRQSLLFVPGPLPRIEERQPDDAA